MEKKKKIISRLADGMIDTLKGGLNYLSAGFADMSAEKKSG